MANEFSKEEIVQFENVVEGFNDALVASKNVNTYGTAGQLMERSNDTIWRPQQYISVGGDRIVGSAVTAKAKLQMSVPASLTIQPNDTRTIRLNWMLWKCVMHCRKAVLVWPVLNIWLRVSTPTF